MAAGSTPNSAIDPSSVRVGVLGAGTMGRGIAEVFALHGFSTLLIDSDPEALQRAQGHVRASLEKSVSKGRLSGPQSEEVLARLLFGREITELSECEFIVEAIVEDEGIKGDAFRQLDAHAPPQAILASNTSSISIGRLARMTGRPEKVIGMHFMNPVPVMKLVEVIRGQATSPDTHERTLELSRALGKTPVSVEDYPGFVANRVLMPMLNEAAFTLMEGVASREDIDTVLRLGMNHPMGPLELADFIGLDVCLSILEVMHEGIGDPKYRPCPLLRRLVDAGHLGRKSGRGFYEYG
jgi:3-hydroxybutyryl-CoA dehydrogenase